MLINDVSVPFSATALRASSRDSDFVSVGLPFICVPRIRINEPCRAMSPPLRQQVSQGNLGFYLCKSRKENRGGKWLECPHVNVKEQKGKSYDEISICRKEEDVSPLNGAQEGLWDRREWK